MSNELSQRLADAFNLPIDQVNQVLNNDYSRCKKTWMKGDKKGQICGRYSEDNQVFCKDHIKQAKSMRSCYTLNSGYRGPYLSKLIGDQLDQFIAKLPTRIVPNVQIYLPQFGIVYLDNLEGKTLYLIDGDVQAFNS